MQFRKTVAFILTAFFLSLGFQVETATAAPKKRQVASKSKTYKAPVKSKRYSKKIKRRAAPVAKVAPVEVPDFDADGNPLLQSAAVLVQDQISGEVLYQKNSELVVPIASITKLMTAMVVLDARQSLDEMLTIGDEDMDYLRGTRSRLAVGTSLTREEMLRLALMSSENRAAATLARHYKGGTYAFIAAMNRKAALLGLGDTRFFDSTGLDAGNVSSARDLVRLVAAAARYPLVREFTTSTEYEVTVNGRPRMYHNTNALVSNPDWQIGVSKTGYINESGKCLVMQAWLSDKPMIIVLLDSWVD